MSFLRNPLALGVLVMALVGIAFVLVGSLIFIVAYRRREKLAWSRGVRVAIGLGGMLLPCATLLLPAIVSWGTYLHALSSLERDLPGGAPDMKAAIIARAVEGSTSVALASDISVYLLVLPCAVLMGLALTVPFYLTKIEGGDA